MLCVLKFVVERIQRIIEREADIYHSKGTTILRKRAQNIRKTPLRIHKTSLHICVFSVFNFLSKKYEKLLREEQILTVVMVL